jgi:hypothetical protein
MEDDIPMIHDMTPLEINDYKLRLLQNIIRNINTINIDDIQYTVINDNVINFMIQQLENILFKFIENDDPDGAINTINDIHICNNNWHEYNTFINYAIEYNSIDVIEIIVEYYDIELIDYIPNILLFRRFDILKTIPTQTYYPCIIDDDVQCINHMIQQHKQKLRTITNKIIKLTNYITNTNDTNDIILFQDMIDYLIKINIM